MREVALVLTVALACLLLPASVQAQTPSSLHPPPSPELRQVGQDIDAGNANWIRAWKTADAGLVTVQFAPDGAEFRDGGQVTRGQSALRQRFTRVFQSTGPASAYTITTQEVWLLDGLAYETGKFTYTFPAKTPSDKPDTGSGHYVTVWQKQKDGHWRIHADFGVPGE